VKNKRFLLLALAIAAASLPLSAQPDPRPPVPPRAPAPPAPFARPDFQALEDLEFKLAPLRDLEFRFDGARMAKLASMQDEISAKVHAKVTDAMSRMESLHDLDFKLEKLRDLEFRIPADKEAKLWNLEHDIAAKVSASVSGAVSNMNFKMPVLMSPQAIFHGGKTTDHERGYENGVRALEGRHYERALEAFSQASMSTGARTDGALYWKAYTLHRLGRRDDALAALAQLRKSHASSKWLGDAQALETEIKQSSAGQTAAQLDADEDLKVMALSGLMLTDPDKAVAKVEQIIKGSSSRKLQEQALRSLANSESQKSRDLLTQIARGRMGNPDLQLRAIRQLGNRRVDNRDLLREIFAGATDEQVKRAALRALGSSEDKEQLLKIAKSDKDPWARMEAHSMLGNSASSTELWPLYQAETSVEVKERILHRLRELGATDRLLEVAKTEKEAKLRQHAIRALGAATTGDALVAMHVSETDQGLKRTIVDALYSHKNGKALIDLARKEKDPQMRREIVSRLSRMDTKEVSDYLVEILK
jgi:tetratricopeptide (TPR) repeat protein